MVYKTFRGVVLSEPKQHRYQQLFEALQANDQVLRDDSKVAWEFIHHAKRSLEETVFLIKKGHIVYTHTPFLKMLNYKTDLSGRVSESLLDLVKIDALRIFNHALETQKASKPCDVCRLPIHVWDLTGKDYYQQRTSSMTDYDFGATTTMVKLAAKKPKTHGMWVWSDTSMVKSLCGTGKKGLLNLAKVLPSEIADHMLLMMDIPELLAMSKVNQSFRGMVLDDSFWRRWAMVFPNETRANVWLKAKDQLVLENTGLSSAVELPMKIGLVGKVCCGLCSKGPLRHTTRAWVCGPCVTASLSSQARLEWNRKNHAKVHLGKLVLYKA